MLKIKYLIARIIGRFAMFLVRLLEEKLHCGWVGYRGYQRYHAKRLPFKNLRGNSPIQITIYKRDKNEGWHDFAVEVRLLEFDGSEELFFNCNSEEECKNLAYAELKGLHGAIGSMLNRHDHTI